MYIFIQPVVSNLCGQKVTTKVGKHIVSSPMCATKIIMIITKCNTWRKTYKDFPITILQKGKVSMLLHWDVKSFSHSFMSLHQNITHGFDVCVSIIWFVSCFVSTRAIVITSSSCTKPDTGITALAIILLVTNDADSCFRVGFRRADAYSIEALLVTVAL